MMNSLMRLSMYNDESERSGSDESEEEHQKRLPLPDFFGRPNNELLSKQENKEGKIRNFPHEPGNWATYVYLPLDVSSEFLDYLTALTNHFKPLNLKLVDDFHISLTRTVILRHHWILDFTKSVQKILTAISTFKIHLFGLKTYANEQKTRSFLSLKVDEGEENLKWVVKQLDNCLKDYNLQCYYNNPSFHVSLLWCPGEKCDEIKKYIDLLPVKLQNTGFYEAVSYCVCASGNKRFRFNL